MKIKRFGAEIELTPAELDAAYDERRLNDMKDTIKSYIQMRDADVCHDIEDIALAAIHNLGKSDSYTEALDLSINHTLGTFIERTEEIRNYAECDAENNFNDGIEVSPDFHLSVMHEYGYSKKEVEYYTACYHSKMASLKETK